MTACSHRTVPVRDESVEEVPLMDFDAGYVQRGRDKFPLQGATMPWRLYQNYVLDRWLLRRTKVADKALQFTRTPRRRRAHLREAA